MELSSRMKDYYDIYYITNKFEFDGVILTEALRKTFANREHNFTIEQFERIMNFKDDAIMQKKWNGFIRKINIRTDNYSIILRTMMNFLEQPFTAAVENRIFNKHWFPTENKWYDS